MRCRKVSRWLVTAAAVCSASVLAASRAPLPPAHAYIVQTHGGQSASRAVRDVGGRITHELPIIQGVSAMLTPAQVARLRRTGTVELYADAAVVTQDLSYGRSSGVSLSTVISPGTTTYQSQIPDQAARVEIGADRLMAQGLDGSGITVAVLDTGLSRSWVPYAAGIVTYSADGSQFDDLSGHGSHVTSVIMAPVRTPDNQPMGIAPNVRLVSVKAFDGNGASSYATVLNGLNWIYANRTTYNIRVLNLSFAANPQSYYWDDPIDQAVMKLWQAGVVVVASAGNWGPTAQTIGVPGNVPYIITVGAMTDNYTPANPLNYKLTSFSSTGPTFEGFVKPDIVAPGGHILGYMNPATALLTHLHPGFQVGQYLFIMSGTSQAAAVVSGSVALMLEANPTLTPDQVKCRLITSARPAVDASGQLAYSVFQQGAGMVNVHDAVYSTANGCANVGLNIAADLAGTAHFGGAARQAADGTYYVVDQNGAQINGQGYLWNSSYATSTGYLWNSGYLWNNGYLWNSGYLWNNGYLWNASATASAATASTATATASIATAVTSTVTAATSTVTAVTSTVTAVTSTSTAAINDWVDQQ